MHWTAHGEVGGRLQLNQAEGAKLVLLQSPGEDGP